MYALVAMGLTLQYGVARIMNLTYGELLIAAAFAALWFYSGLAISPLIGLIVGAAAGLCAELRHLPHPAAAAGAARQDA